jgi:O-antigen/teichoic acid export membrane protein
MGTVLPMIAGVVAVPFLVQSLGPERLGVLSLVWVVVGYFSFLDMGLGRAVTVAIASGRPNPAVRGTDELSIVGTASMLLFGIGTVMALVLGLVVESMGVPVVLSSPAFAEEVRLAVLWMLPSLPLLLISSALRGHLEGVGAFRPLNLLRIPTGVMLVAGPCLSALYSPHLAWACATILVVRLMHTSVLILLVARHFSLGSLHLMRLLFQRSSRAWLRRLLAFGGWVTLSNVVGPVIVYVDRFVIGAALTAASIAFYAVPFDVVSRLPVLVAALCSVLLPEFARLARSIQGREGHTDRLRNLVRRSTSVSTAVVGTTVLLGCLAAPSALQWWLGSDFAAKSTAVTQILFLSFGVNALAQIPFTALQAAGRVRPVALLHLAELLPYCAVLYAGIYWFGLAGAAAAALIRSILDYLMLGWMWHRHSASGAVAPQV